VKNKEKDGKINREGEKKTVVKTKTKNFIRWKKTRNYSNKISSEDSRINGLSVRTTQNVQM
jgi:hypothetical protein